MTVSILRIFLLAAAVVGTQASGVIERQVNGVTRNILYHSRMLEGSCVPQCTNPPTKAPTKAPVPVVNKAPTKRPTTAPTCNCAAGTFLVNAATCQCSSNFCDACPQGTICHAAKQVCVNCECGFCDASNKACCNFNGGGNNCNPNNAGQWKADSDECSEGKGRFPHLGGNGNICSGVEISASATPNGCGCQPGRTAPCIYKSVMENPIVAASDRCFICDVNDFAEKNPACDACKTCVKACRGTGALSCLDGTVAATMATCLMNGGSQADTVCRAKCAQACTKIPVIGIPPQK